MDDFDPRWTGASIPIDHWHFHRQLLLRYGIVLAPGEFSRIHAAIRTGQAQVIQRRSPTQNIYSVRITRLQERIYILAEGSHIITAWPPSARLNEIRRKLKGK
jgi:hypothetical protein